MHKAPPRPTESDSTPVLKGPRACPNRFWTMATSASAVARSSWLEMPTDAIVWVIVPRASSTGTATMVTPAI